MLPGLGVLAPLLPSLQERAVEVPDMGWEHGDFVAGPSVRSGAASAHELSLCVQGCWAPECGGVGPRLGRARLVPDVGGVRNIHGWCVPVLGPVVFDALKALAGGGGGACWGLELLNNCSRAVSKPFCGVVAA